MARIWPTGLDFDSYVLDEQSCMIAHLSVVRHGALLPDSSCLLCDVIGHSHWAGSQRQQSKQRCHPIRFLQLCIINAEAAPIKETPRCLKRIG